MPTLAYGETLIAVFVVAWQGELAELRNSTLNLQQREAGLTEQQSALAAAEAAVMRERQMLARERQQLQVGQGGPVRMTADSNTHAYHQQQHQQQGRSDCVCCLACATIPQCCVPFDSKQAALLCTPPHRPHVID